MKKLFSLVLVGGLALSAGLLGCEQKSDLEKNMEKAAKDTEKAASGAMDAMNEKMGQ